MENQKFNWRHNRSFSLSEKELSKFLEIDSDNNIKDIKWLSIDKDKYIKLESYNNFSTNLKSI